MNLSRIIFVSNLKSNTMKKIFIMLTTIATLSCSSQDDDTVISTITGEGIFTTQVSNGAIEGELFLPDGEGPFPILIVVPGSGNDTRESLSTFAPLFNSFGYGLYIYDKRGIGGSTGTYPTETIENPIDFLSARADDVISIINLLKNHESINTDKIGLFGSSQGTWVSTIAYDRMGDNIGMIIMSSGGVTSTGAEYYYEDLIENSNMAIEDANQEIFNYDGLLGYDPKQTILEMDIPTLFIYGGKDESHPTLYDKEIVEGMQKANFEIHFYENADHSLLDVDTQAYPENLFQNLNLWLNSNN